MKEQYFGQIAGNRSPTLMKTMIEKTNSRAYANEALDEYNNPMDPFMQMLAIDEDAISELRMKKRTIFDNIRARFVKQEKFDEIQIYGNKTQKIIQCYYTIPEEIEKKKQGLSNLKWNEFKRKREIRREIRKLEDKKTKYHDSILKWYYAPNSKEKPEQVQKDWQEYYLSHEQEMLEWIDYQRAKIDLNISQEDKTAFLESYCRQYFQSIGSFGYNVISLKNDIEGNVDLSKAVFGKDYRNAGLLEILQDLRGAMDDKLMPAGMTKFRTSDIPVSIGESFFAMNSKAIDVKSDMDKLAEEYENMKQIENRDEYIDKAVSIFQRFIQIHPYLDGNGRTSRALLDIMLINRDIVPPILYDTYYDRRIVDDLSMEYLANSNKQPLQNYIKKQIARVETNDDNDLHNREINQEMERE